MIGGGTREEMKEDEDQLESARPEKQRRDWK